MNDDLHKNRIFYQTLINMTAQNAVGENVKIEAGTVLFYDPDDKKIDVDKILQMVIKGDARFLRKEEVLEALKQQTATKEGAA